MDFEIEENGRIETNPTEIQKSDRNPTNIIDEIVIKNRFRHNYSEIVVVNPPKVIRFCRNTTEFITKATDYNEIRPTNRPFRSNLKCKRYVIRKQNKGVKRQT